MVLLSFNLQWFWLLSEDFDYFCLCGLIHLGPSSTTLTLRCAFCRSYTKRLFKRFKNIYNRNTQATVKLQIKYFTTVLICLLIYVSSLFMRFVFGGWGGTVEGIMREGKKFSLLQCTVILWPEIISKKESSWKKRAFHKMYIKVMNGWFLCLIIKRLNVVSVDTLDLYLILL